MAETGSPLAGEMSGHIFFADTCYGFDDALYCRGAPALHRGATRRRALAEMRDELPQPVNTPELRFACPDDAEVQASSSRSRRGCRRTSAKFTDVDGVRVSTKDGWWLLRASNTQAVLVARCEAADEAGLEPADGRPAPAAGGLRRRARRTTPRPAITLMRFFFYGTLLDRDGRPWSWDGGWPPPRPTRQRACRDMARRVQGATYPIVIADPCGEVPGAIVGGPQRPRRGAPRGLRGAGLSRRAAPGEGAGGR